MARAVDRFEAEARSRGLALGVRRFPQGTKTAADAAAAVGCDIGQIVKSLVFMADGEPLVALTSGRNRVDMAVLGELIGAGEVRRATPEEAREATGYAIGGTPPFGHRGALRVLLDPDLMGYEVVWAAAGSPDAVFPIAPEALAEASSAELTAFAERPDRSSQPAP